MFKLISILFIIYLFKLNSGLITENNNDPEFVDYYDNDDSLEKQTCSLNSLVNQIESYIPNRIDVKKDFKIRKIANNMNESIAIVKNLVEMFKTNSINNVIKRLVQRISELMLITDLPPECMSSIVKIAESARNMEGWALRFIDSQFKWTSGMLEVSGFPIGEYDECLAIKGPDLDDKPPIRGQYCAIGRFELFPDPNTYEMGDPIDDYFLVMIEQYLNRTYNGTVYWKTPKMFTNNGKLQLNERIIKEVLIGNHYFRDFISKVPIGVCLPTTCDPIDIQNAINKFFYPAFLFTMSINPDCDYEGKPHQWNNYQIFSILVFVILVILVMMATILDILRINLEINLKNSYINGYVNSYSMVNNFKEVFDSKPVNEKLKSIDGIRALLTLYIFIQHEYEAGMTLFATKNLLNSATLRGFLENQYWILYNYHIMEAFLFIGGLLVCYLMLSKLKRSRFNYFQYVFFRYMRTIPALIVTFLIVFCFPLLGSGPNWKLLSDLNTNFCYNNWYSTVLMIQNYNVHYPLSYPCNPVTWSISTDFQLFCLAPIVFLFMHYYPKYTIIYTLTLTLIGCLIYLSVRYVFGIISYFEFRQLTRIDELLQFSVHQYWGVESHLSSYFLGMLCGYLIREKPNLNFGGKFGELLIWLLTLTATGYGSHWHRRMYNLYEYFLTDQELLLWMMFAKLLFVSGWFWTIYACCTGRAEIVNNFLGWKVWKVFSNISFEFFILHIIMMCIRFGELRGPERFTDYYIWTVTAYDFVTISLASVIFALVVTLPFANLLKLLMNKINKPDKS